MSRQDEFSFRLAQWLLDQLYSEEELKTVTQQFSVLVSQAQSESIEALYSHIGRLIFQKFIRAKTQSTQLYVHLCHSLFIANLKRRSDISTRLTPIHEHLFQCCLGHLSSGDHSELQRSARGTDGSSTDSTQPGACASGSCSDSEGDTALAISLLILELYKCGLVSVAHVYEYTFQLATLSKLGDLTSRLNAVRTLLDSCFSRLDTGLWKVELELLQDWAKSLVLDTSTDQEGVQQLTNLLNRMLNPEQGPDANAGDLGTTFGRLSVSVTAQPIASGHDTSTSAGNDDGCSSDLNNIISDLGGIVHSPQSQIYDEEGEDSTGNNYGDYMHEAGSMESLDSLKKGDEAKTSPALNAGTHRPQSKRYGHVLHPFAVVDPSQREIRPTRPTQLYPQHHFSSSESSFSSAGSVPALPVSSPSSMSSSVAALILNKKQKRDRLTKVVEAQVEQEKKVKERPEKAKRSREDTVLDWLEREKLRSMSFASLGSSASSGNPSLAWFMGNGGKGRIIIEFPFPLTTGWYLEQPCTKFRTFQHRKERRGFQHEFVVLSLLDGSVCRVERMGDPNARFDALSPHGSVACDMAQCFRPDELELACLGSSDVIAEVELPKDLDLIDVLKVCRAIHEGEKTRNYTLQVFNCYFFSLAIQVCLTRLIARWEDQEWLGAWLSKIRTGTARFTDAFKPIMDSGLSRSLHAFDRIYSILAPEDSDNTAFTRRIELKLHARWNDRSIQQDLTNHVNNVLWHAAMRLELDQFIKDEVGRAMGSELIKNINGSVPYSGPWPSESVKAMKAQLLLGLAKLVEPKGTSTNLYPPHVYIKQRTPVTSQVAPFPETTISEMTFKSASKSRASKQISAHWPKWIVNCLIYMGYLVLQALHFTTLSLCGVVLLSLGADPIEYSILDTDQGLESIATELENLADMKASDLARIYTRLQALTENKARIATWSQSPWSILCRYVKHHVAENISECIELNKPELAIRLKEWSESKLVSVLAFQEHITGRIGIHAKIVERVGLGSAEIIGAELNNTLSQVWELIREDYTSEAMCNISPFSRIFNRLYEAREDSEYKSKLDIWSDRVGLARIRFVTDLTDHRDEQGRHLYQAFPLFPSLKFVGQNYVAQGQSEQEACQNCLSRIPLDQFNLRSESITYNFDYHGDGSVVAKPFLVRYGDCVQLTNGEVVGWGTSRASAEEMAAGRLLCSGRYCYYN